MAPIGIPLLCVICPGTPKFSDKSHLLTHLASKAHLAHHYKAKVRAVQDASTRRLVQGFEKWFDNHHLGDALATRVIERDRKKAAKANAAANASATGKPDGFVSTLPFPPGYSSSAGSSLLVPKIERNSNIPAWVDPSLLPVNHHAAYSNGHLPIQHPVYTQQDGFHPNMALWNAPAPHTVSSSAPTAPFTAGFGQTASYTHTVSHHGNSPLNEESRLLKGNIYPGMDVFDSATDSAKRKRNQRKDDSVLDRLMRHSQSAEPNELVHDQNGEFRRALPITGQPEGSSTNNSPASNVPRPPSTPAKTPTRARTQSWNRATHSHRRNKTQLNSRQTAQSFGSPVSNFRFTRPPGFQSPQSGYSTPNLNLPKPPVLQRSLGRNALPKPPVLQHSLGHNALPKPPVLQHNPGTNGAMPILGHNALPKPPVFQPSPGTNGSMPILTSEMNTSGFMPHNAFMTPQHNQMGTMRPSDMFMQPGLAQQWPQSTGETHWEPTGYNIRSFMAHNVRPMNHHPSMTDQDPMKWGVEPYSGLDMQSAPANVFDDTFDSPFDFPSSSENLGAEHSPLLHRAPHA